jgi:methyltransferase family protein
MSVRNRSISMGRSISDRNGSSLTHLLDRAFGSCHTRPMAAATPSERMVEPTAGAEDRSEHWEGVYRRLGPENVSWFQLRPAVSLDLITQLGVSPQTPVIDVGGGASCLVDSLLELGFSDVSVLDVSSNALQVVRRRVGPDPAAHWLPDDLLTWQPPRRYGLWHDRAVFHFLVDPGDRERYLRVLFRALVPRGHIVVATFAQDGPARCSGLPVARYGPEELASVFGEAVDILASRREQHTTPAGVVQPFTWVAGRVRGERP